MNNLNKKKSRKRLSALLLSAAVILAGSFPALALEGIASFVFPASDPLNIESAKFSAFTAKDAARLFEGDASALFSSKEASLLGSGASTPVLFEDIRKLPSESMSKAQDILDSQMTGSIAEAEDPLTAHPIEIEGEWEFQADEPMSEKEMLSEAASPVSAEDEFYGDVLEDELGEGDDAFPEDAGLMSLGVTMNLVYGSEDSGLPVYAGNQVYYIALFTDAELTQRITDVTPMTFSNGNVSTITFPELPAQTVLYLAEVNPDGTPFMGDDFLTPHYAVQGSRSIEIAPIAAGDLQNIVINNIYSQLPEGFYFMGSLVITKDLIDPSGSGNGLNEIFYAGIFTDEAYGNLAGNVNNNIVPLPMNGGTTSTTSVDVTLTGATPEDASATFYIGETDASGSWLGETFLYNDVSYTVSGSGAVTVTPYDTASAVLTNTVSGGGPTYSLTVTKNLVRQSGTETEAMTADNQVFYVALFEDTNLSAVVDGSFAGLNFQGASSSSVTIDGLENGTYYLAEVDAEGHAYSSAFFATQDYVPSYINEGNAYLTVTVDGANANAEFSNVFREVQPAGNTYEGQITITKKVQTSSGVEARSNGTFYAGIFLDEGFTQLAPAGTDGGAVVSQNIVQLSMGGTTTGTGSTTVYMTAPSEAEASRVLYITETDSSGTPVNREGFTQGGITYSVSVSPSQVTVTTTEFPAVSIINTAIATGTTPTPTPAGSTNTNTTTLNATPTPGTVAHEINQASVPGSVSPVNTADETPIGLYVMLLAGAAAAAAFASACRKRMS